MKHLKFVIAGFGVLGVVAIFLPYFKMGPLSVAVWDAKDDEAAKTYITLVAFLIPAVMGIMASVQGKLVRWQSIVAAVGFGLAFLPPFARNGLSPGKAVGAGDAVSGGIGAYLLFFAAVLGLVAAIAAIVKPDEAA